MIAERAAAIRAAANQIEPPFSTRQIMEAVAPDAIVTGDHLPSGIDEMVTRVNGVPIIVYQRGLPTCQQRVAIAHALAHVIWDLDTPGVGCRPGRAGIPELEERADRFAAELLVPLDELRPYVRLGVCPGRRAWLDMIDELASHFQAPAWVISEQIQRLSS